MLTCLHASKKFYLRRLERVFRCTRAQSTHAITKMHASAESLIKSVHHPSSGKVGCLPIGRSFTRLAASKHTVCSSENVSVPSPIARVIALLTDLINASDVPFAREHPQTKRTIEVLESHRNL